MIRFGGGDDREHVADNAFRPQIVTLVAGGVAASISLAFGAHLIEAGTNLQCRPAVLQIENQYPMDLIETAAFCDPTMPDGEDFGGDIEVAVVVDECEVMRGSERADQ